LAGDVWQNAGSDRPIVGNGRAIDSGGRVLAHFGKNPLVRQRGRLGQMLRAGRPPAGRTRVQKGERTLQRGDDAVLERSEAGLGHTGRHLMAIFGCSYADQADNYGCQWQQAAPAALTGFASDGTILRSGTQLHPTQNTAPSDAHHSPGWLYEIASINQHQDGSNSEDNW
jgi:hypothetical protein